MRNEIIKIGACIRKRRQLLKLLQPDLAAISGVSTRTLQLIEAGKANPSLETLLNISGSLGLDLKLSIKETDAGIAAGLESQS